jgi:hypothetical protein
VSLLGPLNLKRRYSYCAGCQQGFAPSHKALGLPEGDYTAHLEDAATQLATTVPHAMAMQLLARCCGIQLSVKASEQMVGRRATALQAIDQAEAQAMTPYDPKGLAVAEQSRPCDAVAEQRAAKIVYLELDGVIPMTREQLTGKELSIKDKRRQQRAKDHKVRGGKARRYRMIGREVKNAVLYDGQDCAKESAERGCILHKTYVSHLGDWLTFAMLLWVAILRLRFDKAKLLVILSDGAEWIRSLAHWLPIDVLLILDLFHVKHRIWEVAHSLYGEHSAKAREWAEIQAGRIEDGQPAKVLQALRFLKPHRRETQELVDKLHGYLKDNRDRMNYPDYRARGLRVSSSAVESANYHVTGARLKLQGMRWSPQGAGQMALLRADLFNEQWEKRTRTILAA